jgi:photosystem II stability/assembly factor-like uncharacterized protein
MRNGQAILALAVLLGGALAAMPKAGANPTVTLTTLKDGIPHQALVAVAFENKDGIAVGFNGEIQETQDGGAHWQNGKPFNNLSLLGVTKKSGSTLAVGQSGLILVRQGNGDWTQADSGTTERLFDVSLGTNNHAVAVGSFGTILVSSDAGQSWKMASPDWGSLITGQGLSFQPHLYGASIDDKGVMTVVGEAGTIVRSSDDGATWTVVHKGNPEDQKENASLLAINLRPDGAGYAVGQDGAILHTTDSGLTWSVQESGTNSILLGVTSTPDGTVLVTAMYSMLVSKDGGKSWYAVVDPGIKSSWSVGIAAVDGGSVVVGRAGTILRVNP